MAVVKVFDANGVKTVELMGNVNEQSYDTVEEQELDYPDEDE